MGKYIPGYIYEDERGKAFLYLGFGSVKDEGRYKKKGTYRFKIENRHFYLDMEYLRTYIHNKVLNEDITELQGPNIYLFFGLRYSKSTRKFDPAKGKYWFPSNYFKNHKIISPYDDYLLVNTGEKDS